MTRKRKPVLTSIGLDLDKYKIGVDTLAGMPEFRLDKIASLFDDEKAGEETMAKSVQIALRLEPETLERIDKEVELFRANHPGVHYSRTDAVRAYIHKGLEADDAERRQGQPGYSSMKGTG